MDALLGQFGDVIGAVVEHPIVQTAIAGAAAYVVVVWLATAYWALQDLRRRHPSPALPFVAAAGIILASPVLFPLAVVVYRVLRPGETLAQAHERELADRLTALEAQELLSCPGCAMAVEESWLACPACRSRLAHQCHACGRTMGLDWTVCAWCGSEFGEPVIPETQPRVPQAAIAEPMPEYRRGAEVARA